MTSSGPRAGPRHTYALSAFIEANKCYSNWALTLVFEHPDGRTSDPVAVDCGEQRVAFDF